MKPLGRWKSLSEIETRQRNTVWPDTLRNGSLVDAFVWRGSPNATYIQRIGTALFGLLFLCPAVLLIRFGFFEVGPALFRLGAGPTLAIFSWGDTAAHPLQAASSPARIAWVAGRWGRRRWHLCQLSCLGISWAHCRVLAPFLAMPLTARLGSAR